MTKQNSLHNISILQHYIGKKISSLNATDNCTIKYTNHVIKTIAYLTVNFEDGSIAHFHVNWMSPIKIRQIIIGGSKKMLVFDDMLQAEKIKIYDSGINLNSKEDIYETLIQYRVGDMTSPAISNKEALKEEVEYFYHSIQNKNHTLTDGEAGLYVVKILEAANQSLKNNGELILL